MNKSSYNKIFQQNEDGKEGGSLYLGNWASTMNKDLTDKVGAIVNCTKAVHPEFDEKNEKIPFQRVNMQESGLEKYERSFKFIDEHLTAGKNVLVHCAAGACRSVAICIYFLMKKNNWTLKETHEKLKSIRPEVADLKEESLHKYVIEIQKFFQ